jgi:hypothetical protein
MTMRPLAVSRDSNAGNTRYVLICNVLRVRTLLQRQRQSLPLIGSYPYESSPEPCCSKQSLSPSSQTGLGRSGAQECHGRAMRTLTHARPGVNAQRKSAGLRGLLAGIRTLQHSAIGQGDLELTVSSTNNIDIEQVELVPLE